MCKQQMRIQLPHTPFIPTEIAHCITKIKVKDDLEVLQQFHKYCIPEVDIKQ